MMIISEYESFFRILPTQQLCRSFKWRADSYGIRQVLGVQVPLARFLFSTSTTQNLGRVLVFARVNNLNYAQCAQKDVLFAVGQHHKSRYLTYVDSPNKCILDLAARFFSSQVHTSNDHPRPPLRQLQLVAKTDHGDLLPRCPGCFQDKPIPGLSRLHSATAISAPETLPLVQPLPLIAAQARGRHSSNNGDASTVGNAVYDQQAACTFQQALDSCTSLQYSTVSTVLLHF